MKYLSKTVGLLGLITGVVFVVSIMDGCVAGFRKPKREYSAVPGQVVKIVEKAPGPIEQAASISFSSSCSSIRPSVTEIRGRLWHGRIEIPENTVPADCTISVTYPGYERKEQVYRLKIFPTRKALLADSYSLFEKWAGWNPWIIAAISSTILMILMMVSYCISLLREKKQKNFGEIRDFRSEGGKAYVYFLISREDDIEPGQPLALIDVNGNIAGLARVLKINGSRAAAEVMHFQGDLKPSGVSWNFDDIRRAAGIGGS
ncbi:hypothetical protein [Thermodesulforhabdus norvegica]|uniref:Uncharacterized protein n=1 Tax=Thermodesulforhabdus norvegica TaxID=39841 RepID=A0A1I4U579_9BACT|nr:hypothetical protein [Thermodesulforhabdus norvegica]SFM84194.1 hypothetical protein SAMN05660836_01648 [Thermodesulforhabdus norvegica]